MVVWVQAGCEGTSCLPSWPMADWGLWLAVTAQHHKRALYHVLLAWEKIQIPNSKYSFYWMCNAFVSSQKIVSRTIVSQELSVVDNSIIEKTLGLEDQVFHQNHHSQLTHAEINHNVTSPICTVKLNSISS